MGPQVTVGDRLFRYQVTAVIKDNSVYQWVKATDPNQQTVILQVLIASVDASLCRAIVAYFDALHSIKRQGLWIPTDILSDKDYPLVAVYTDLPTQPLTLDQQPVARLEEASEALFALHNKRLVHGCVTIDSFVLVNNKVHLTNFGYNPLLNAQHPETLMALQSSAEFLAPETARESLEITADAYAFAKMAAQWQPQLVQTQWYDQATKFVPSNRFQRMRELFDVFKQALANLSGNPPPEAAAPPQEPPPEPQQSPLVPKYRLQGRVEPAEAGTVEGAGSYRAGETVTLRAIAAKGWQFGQWAGDATGEDPVVMVKVDGNRDAIAHFTPAPVVKITLPSTPPRRSKGSKAVAWAQPTPPDESESTPPPAATVEPQKKAVSWAQDAERAAMDAERGGQSGESEQGKKVPGWAQPKDS